RYVCVQLDDCVLAGRFRLYTGCGPGQVKGDVPSPGSTMRDVGSAVTFTVTDPAVAVSEIPSHISAQNQASTLTRWSSVPGLVRSTGAAGVIVTERARVVGSTCCSSGRKTKASNPRPQRGWSPSPGPRSAGGS